MINIPSENRAWKSLQKGDLYGSVVESKNLDFNRPGYLQLARKSMCLFNTDIDDVQPTDNDSPDFGTPLAMATDDEVTYVVTDEQVFMFDVGSDDFSQHDSGSPGGGITPINAPSFGLDTDALIFQGILHVSGGSSIKSYDRPGDDWDTRVTGLSAAAPHPLCVAEHLDSLAVGNGNSVRLYDDNYSLTTTLVIPEEYVVTCIRFRQDRLYIGTRNVGGGSAKMFIWTGAGSAAQAAYSVNADWIYSVCEYGSSMTLCLSSGQVVRFNGGGFDHLTAFPVYYTPYSWTRKNASEDRLVGRMGSRGMDALGETLYLNISGELENDRNAAPGKYLPSMPSGLWTYDPDTGLNHRAGYNYTTRVNLTPTTVASSHLVFSEAHGAETGDAVLYSDQSGITGLTEGQIYYAIKDSDTSIMLALTPADALNGDHITLSGTPAAGDVFQFDSHKSASALTVEEPGAVMVFSREHPNLFYGSEVLFGGTTYNEDMDDISVLLSLGMGRNVGHFVTPKILANRIQDTFNKIVNKYTPFILPTQEIVVKYRLEERYGFPVSTRFSSAGLATWTSTSTFTVDTRYRDFKRAEIGDEISVVEGSGAGYTAHITAISNVGDTYTVTLDEEFPVETGEVMDFVLDNWKKLTTITTESNDHSDAFNTSGIDKAQSKWAQFKIELRGVNMALEQVIINNEPHQKVL